MNVNRSTALLQFRRVGIAASGRAAVTEPPIKTLPEPKTGRGELVVRIASSGICETDVWVYRSGALSF